MTPADILSTAAGLVSKDRAETYGDFVENHFHIAAAWEFWLKIRRPGPLTAFDGLMMMALMKIARIPTGKGTVDNFIDACGYLALAGVAWLRSKQ